MRNNRAGFTLIEFSICSLATMVMLGATFTLMNMIFTANSGMSDIMATQSNIRVAINTIARDITMAGTGLPSTSVESPNGLNSAAIVRPGMSSLSVNLYTPSDAFPFLSPGNDVGPEVTNETDVITIFTIDQATPTWTVSSVAIATGVYTITFTDSVTSGEMQLEPGDLLLFNNSNGAVLACVSEMHSTVAAAVLFNDTSDLMGVNQTTAAGGNLGSLSNTNPATSSYPATTAIKVQLINYYISTANAAHPRLMRAVNAETPQAIAEDIENLQFAYDTFDYDTEIQTSGENTTSSPSQIRAVRVAITGRSPEVLKNTTEYYRTELVSKINVRNATFRNRYTGS